MINKILIRNRLGVACVAIFLICACVNGEFSLPTTAGKERETHADLVKELEKLNLDEVRSKSELGELVAISNMALMYILGVQVEQNFDEGVHWLRNAEEKNDSIAMYNLGIAYLKGVGKLDKDWIQAHMYMNIACFKAKLDGFSELASWACRTRSEIEDAWSFMVRSRRATAQEKAYQYMNEKFGSFYAFINPQMLENAKTGKKYEMYFLGADIHMGSGAPQHDITAYYWYTLGLPGGHKDVIARRGMLLTRMSKEQLALGDKMVAELKPDQIPLVVAPTPAEPN